MAKGGTRIQLGVSVNTTAVDRLLLKMKTKNADLRPVFYNVVDPSVTKFFEEQFATEGAAGGKPWKSLAALTVRLRGRSGHGLGGILRDTGVLWSSFTKTGGPMSIRRVEKHEYERGSRAPTAALHQVGWRSSSVFGRKRKSPRKIPARPVVPSKMPTPLVTFWEGALTKHILG